MKNIIDKIIVALFVVAMFLIMSISAHAETGNRYIFTSMSLPSAITWVPRQIVMNSIWLFPPKMLWYINYKRFIVLWKKNT